MEDNKRLKQVLSGCHQEGGTEEDRWIEGIQDAVAERVEGGQWMDKEE
jgi:hypothetical protein